MSEPTLIDKLTKILNGHENDSNTPDFILAAFLADCLNAWEDAIRARAAWYGRMDVPGQKQIPWPSGDETTMSGTINETPCPKCEAANVLYVDINFVAKPIGTFSLSGSQMKVSGRERPVLKCRNCDFNLPGEFDNGSHVVFDPSSAKEEID